jgi:hypothetical protein
MDSESLFAKIPQKQLLIYLLILGVVPLLFVGYFFFSELGQVDTVQENVESIQYIAESVGKKQAANIATHAKYEDADHFYIDKNLETLKFLEPEREDLKKLTVNPNYIDDEATNKRLEFLSGKQNNLTFTESNVQSTPFFTEVTETLLHPVEINVSDLKKILTLIEGKEIGEFKTAPQRPQLQILDLKLEKKNIRENNEVFDLNMKLLKREFP